MSSLCIIRTDAGPGIGGGHVVRCIALAEELHALGWQVIIAATKETFEATGMLIPDWLQGYVLSSESIDFAFQLCQVNPDGCDLLIIDQYNICAEYEKIFRNWAKRIFIIDDLVNRNHECDFLLDQTFGRKSSDYTKFVSKNCQILAGSEYALIRKSYSKVRFFHKREGEKKNKIVVSMGFSDPNGYSIFALDALNSVNLDLEVEVIIGSCSPYLKEILHHSRRSKNVSVHVDCNDTANLLSSSSLCIGAMGVSSLERCCLGLPTLAVMLADNQKDNMLALTNRGAVELFDITSIDSAAAQITNIITNDNKLKIMKTRAFSICDGLGAARTTMFLVPEHDNFGNMITLRPYSATDEDLVYSWQSMENRTYFTNPGVPSRFEHHIWSQKRLKNPRLLTELVFQNDVPVGLIRIDPTENSIEFEVSIILDRSCHRKGVGIAALRLLPRYFPNIRLIAKIDPLNTASCRLFKKAGYKYSSVGLFVREYLQ